MATRPRHLPGIRGSRAVIALVGALALVAVVLPASPSGAHDPDPDPDPPPGFVDVGTGHPFYEHINWMATKKISNGWADGTYRPGEIVSRQGFIVFLWRMSGSPAGPFPDPGLADVTPDHAFYVAIAWAVDAGIIAGFPDGTFRSGAPLTRQALAKILHGLSGMHRPHPNRPWDVPGTHPFAMAIGWHVATGQADGFPDGSYRPGAPVLRQSVAVFLANFFEMTQGHWPVGGHHMECTDPVTPDQQAAADQLVVDIFASLERWADLDDAIADGYRWVAPPFGSAGAHYLNNEFMTDGEVANPLKPESLMYEQTESGPKLQGAMFLMEDTHSHGPRIGGCLTTWHTHDNLCYDAPPLPAGTVVGLSDLTGCFGDSMVRVTPQMLHVWIIPRPGGPFEGLET